MPGDISTFRDAVVAQQLETRNRRSAQRDSTEPVQTFVEQALKGKGHYEVHHSFILI